MSTDLTADLAQLATDVQTRAADLADRIRAATPDRHVPTCFIDNLDLAVTVLTQLADMAKAGDLYLRADWFDHMLAQRTEPAYLDEADPDTNTAEYATAGT